MSHRRRDDDYYDDEETSGRPLTIAERRALRRIIENEERIQWFWGSVRVWAGWISGAIIGGWALVEIISKVWKRTLE
jgi:hypothetical protein